MRTVQSRGIDKDTEFTVFGYCRRIENHLSSQHIPNAVLSLLCIKYYFMNEHFENHGSNIILNKMKDIINWRDDLTNIDINNRWRAQPQNTCYGNIWIDPMNKSFTRYQWRFKILNCSQLPTGFYLGIDSCDKSLVKADFGRQQIWGKKHYFYGFTSRQNTFSQAQLMNENEPIPFMGRLWNKGDILEMILDIEYGELELYVNDQCRNTLYIKVNGKVKYHLAVRLSSPQQSIQLLTFDAQ